MECHLVGQLVGLGVIQLERIELRQQDGAARGFLVAHLDGFPVELAQAVGVAVGEVDGDRDPLPAFGGQGLGFLLQLVMDQAVEQGRVLQPAAAIVLEKIAGDLAAGGLVALDANERGAAVIGGVDGSFPSLRQGSSPPGGNRNGFRERPKGASRARPKATPGIQCFTCDKRAEMRAASGRLRQGFYS